MTKAKKSIDFENSLDQLEDLVDDMENGDLTLEESLQAFEQGIKLTRECQSALTQAEQKVQLLVKENGKLIATALDQDLAADDNVDEDES